MEVPLRDNLLGGTGIPACIVVVKKRRGCPSPLLHDRRQRWLPERRSLESASLPATSTKPSTSSIGISKSLNPGHSVSRLSSAATTERAGTYLIPLRPGEVVRPEPHPEHLDRPVARRIPAHRIRRRLSHSADEGPGPVARPPRTWAWSAGGLVPD